MSRVDWKVRYHHFKHSVWGLTLRLAIWTTKLQKHRYTVVYTVVVFGWGVLWGWVLLVFPFPTLEAFSTSGFQTPPALANEVPTFCSPFSGREITAVAHPDEVRRTVGRRDETWVVGVFFFPVFFVRFGKGRLWQRGRTVGFAFDLLRSCWKVIWLGSWRDEFRGCAPDVWNIFSFREAGIRR